MFPFPHLLPTHKQLLTAPLTISSLSLPNSSHPLPLTLSTSKQLPNVGFVNPLLYKIAADQADAFNDITEGNNRCSEGGCWCHTGFAAAPGW
jgi:hypothetical protein